MAAYEYHCDRGEGGCGNTFLVSHRGDRYPCPNCTWIAKRKFSFTAAPSFSPHFNHAVGEYVSTDREFRDALKRKSEANSIRAGMDHDYQPLYPSDMRAMEPTTDTHAIETARRNIHDKATATGIFTPGRTETHAEV